ncbi:MAG TPA: MopE-related protein [Chitinophagales bacterium]|nr:MopE-related protein [Chitinophagales bacterium]
MVSLTTGKTQLFILQFIKRSFGVIRSYFIDRSFNMGAIAVILFTFLTAFGLTNCGAQDTWAQKASFAGSARYGAVGFSIGTKGYIGTGFDFDDFTNDFWEYDPATNAWTQKASFGGAARYAAVGFSIGTKGYIGAGYNFGNAYKDFWEYDPVSNTWTQKADFGGTARSGAVGFSIGSQGYIGTGWDFNNFTNDFWEYDPATDIWTQKAGFAGTGRIALVGFSIGSKGYIGTGYDGTDKNDFWEYDPSTNAWTQKADFGGIARDGAVGFCIGSRGYIGTGGDQYSNMNDFWEYDPASDAWTQKTNFGGTARDGAVGFSIGNIGYIGTGFDDSYDYTNDFWEYTPECNGFTAYVDADNDGFGDISSSIFVSDCILPAGYVMDSSDCNDNNALVNPFSIEVCDGIDNNCDGNIDEGVLITFYADADGDTYGNSSDSTLACSMPGGYVINNTDCDDNNAAVNPAALEICDGIDNNCDGNIDEGLLLTFYADADGDTFGDASNSTLACSQPGGYVADNSDCDDNNVTVNPAAPEICDGIDNNCDGNIDEGLLLIFYADADGDTYGDAGNSTLACSMPGGYVTDTSDCDDNNALVNPGAPEICNTIDDNCNGQTDEGVQSVFYADNDNDGYGTPATSVLACSAPIGYVSDNTDCDDNNVLINPGAIEVCNTIDDNCNGETDEGVQSVFYADNDNDGYGTPANSVLACSAPIGYVSDNTDCDDNNVMINPGVLEVCNTVDDNCNGETDEGVQSVFYADNDNDGYGTPATSVLACSAPIGYVSDNTDCDDNNSMVHPGASEICNSIDDNCISGIDEGLVFIIYYQDADADGFGNPLVSDSTCNGAPAGFVTDNTDCNDNNPTVYPGAQEITNNGIDDNCNGVIDEFGVGINGLNAAINFTINPNPATDQAIILFSLPQSSHVYINVYDVSGQEVEILLNDIVVRGDHSLLLNINHFAKGIYLVKMIADFGIQNEKLIVQ